MYGKRKVENFHSTKKAYSHGARSHGFQPSEKSIMQPVLSPMNIYAIFCASEKMQSRDNLILRTL